MDSTNILNAAWPFLIMAFLFYFMLYRPQKKQQNERATLLNGLKVGAKIVTIGGIFGEITKIHGSGCNAYSRSYEQGRANYHLWRL